MAFADNKTLFATTEFDVYAKKRNLLPVERYLIERFLDKRRKTLEGGTGNGRITFEMKKMGFTSLYAYDYISEFIDIAKLRNPEKDIYFDVQDATKLKYKDSYFGQLVYLAQFICMIEDEKGRLSALKEAYRVLKPNGTAIFSFLSFEARCRDPKYWPYLAYLSFVRTLSGSKTSSQYFPWLRLGGKFNFSSMLDSRPYVYWYKIQEACKFVEQEGFEVISIGSEHQINSGKMCRSFKELLKQPITGMLYIVCKK